jgi:response regulator RpfG family c-di-GMP phosphodiesterase
MLDSPAWMLTPPEDDPVFTRVIAPWLAAQHDALIVIDALRPPEPWYVFHTHVMRVAEMGRDFALHLGAPVSAAAWFHNALRIHDCGKTLLPVEIWDQEDKPSESIKLQRRRHAPLGGQMIEESLPHDHPFTAFAADIARHHHEQMNGKGFLGVNAAELNVWVRIACIVDSFDGMSVWRPHYKDRDISPLSVFERLAVEKGPAVYDETLTEAFGYFLRS